MSDEKDTKVSFPDDYKKFSIVKDFITETEMKSEARDLMSHLLKKVNKHIMKFPNQESKELQSNLLMAMNTVKTYCAYRKHLLTDQLYILELVRKLTPEQRLIYQDMRKAMGVDVLGHALEGDLSVGEIFGLEKKITGKSRILEDPDDSGESSDDKGSH